MFTFLDSSFTFKYLQDFMFLHAVLNNKNVEYCVHACKKLLFYEVVSFFCSATTSWYFKFNLSFFAIRRKKAILKMEPNLAHLSLKLSTHFLVYYYHNYIYYTINNL